MRSYQIFKNDSPKTNPFNTEGQGPFSLIGIADCATPSGPVDARSIAGLGKNYNHTRDFLAECEKLNYLAKESTGCADDVTDEQAKTFPKPGKSGGDK